jgi:diadenylate cyclase
MDLSLELFHIGFLRFTLIDVVDISIVAFVLYRLYAVMRGTIAAQIFIGLLLIIAVSFVSRTLDMKLLSWVLRTAGDIWVIALVILFQPELRRILLLVGRNGLFTTFERYDVGRTIEELVLASDDLALRRFGALIVVTRTSDISLSVDTGVPVNAEISKEMFVSIFNPKSPLHDGAVVVSGDQIKSARVILPLSPVTRASDLMLGTRHRAGLGISEQADVFVIIISEESGNISYAREGKLYYDQSLDSLRSALASALEITGSEHGWLRGMFSRFSHHDSGDDGPASGGAPRIKQPVKAKSA